MQAVCGPTDLQGPAGSMFVVVTDALQLAAACQLPGYKLQAPPEAFTVQEHKELCHHSGRKQEEIVVFSKTKKQQKYKHDTVIYILFVPHYY